MYKKNVQAAEHTKLCYRATLYIGRNLVNCCCKPVSCKNIAKFHYTGLDTGPTGPDRTRTDPHGLFCSETPLGPCGSVRVRSGPVGPVSRPV